MVVKSTELPSDIVSTLDPLFMPYGPTKMVNGQNTGSRAVAIQAQKGDVELISPTEFASAKAVFPRPKM